MNSLIRQLLAFVKEKAELGMIQWDNDAPVFWGLVEECEAYDGLALVAARGTVLNQDSVEPMSGQIVGHTPDFLTVRWCDGVESQEYRSDVLLTGDVRFVPYEW